MRRQPAEPSVGATTRRVESASTRTPRALSAGPARRELRKWLLSRAHPVLGTVAMSALARTVMLLAGGALMGAAAHGIVIASGTKRLEVPTLLWILIGLSLVGVIARSLERYTGHVAATRAQAQLRTYFYQRLELQAPSAVYGRQSADLVSRATGDISNIAVFFAHAVAPIITAVVVPVLVGIWLAATIGPVIALVAIIFWVFIGAVVPTIGAGPSSRATQRLRVARSDVAQHVTDSIQGVHEVLAFDHGQRRRADLADLGVVVAREMKVLGRWLAMRRGLNAALVSAAITVILLVGAARVRTGDLAWADLVVALTVIIAVMPAVLAVQECAADLDTVFTSAARVAEVTEADLLTPIPQVPASLTPGPYEVRFERVSFAYPELDAHGAAPDAISEVSLVLEPGTVTALVGASGAGKSTMSRLLMRFWDPRGGTVSVGGTDLRDLVDDDLRSLVTVVSPDTYLLNDTLEANLRLARPGATAAQIAEACQGAALRETLSALPDGLATKVGENGERLTAGQRQRVAMARALLRDTPVLIFDGMTSELDSGAEADLSSALAAMVKGRTTLVIAHRLSSAVSNGFEVDRVVELAAGRIVSDGATT